MAHQRKQNDDGNGGGEGDEDDDDDDDDERDFCFDYESSGRPPLSQTSYIRSLQTV